MNDTQRLDKLEKFMIKNNSNGLAFMPLNNNTLFSIDDIQEEDGSSFNELCKGGSLRSVIDNLKEVNNG